MSLCGGVDTIPKEVLVGVGAGGNELGCLDAGERGVGDDAVAGHVHAAGRGIGNCIIKRGRSQ